MKMKHGDVENERLEWFQNAYVSNFAVDGHTAK
jgi:hypothetical protein